LTAQDLLDLCNSENCGIYLDCSFSAGSMDEYQHLAKRIKGAGYCKLLDARNIPTQHENSLLSVNGPVTVQGLAWVYSLERKEARREEGIWRFDFRDHPRPLHFSRSEIRSLCLWLKLERDWRNSASLAQPDDKQHPTTHNA